MRSLRTFTNRIIIVGAAAFLLSILAISGSIHYSMQLQQYNDSYRSTLSRINSTVSTLYIIENSGLTEASLEQLVERVFELRNRIQECPLCDEPSGIEGIADELRSGDRTARHYIDLLGNYARSLSETYHERNLAIRRRFTYSLVAGPLLMIFIFGALLVLRINVIRFTVRVQEDIDSIRAQQYGLSPKTADYSNTWEEERRVYEAIVQLSEEIDYSYTLSNIVGEGTLESSIPTIYPHVKARIPCDRLALAFLDFHDNVTAESAFSDLSKVLLEPGFTEPIEQTTLKSLTLNEEPRIINDLEQHYREVHQSKSTKLVLKEGVRSSITVPLFIAQRCVGFLFISSAEKHIYNETHRHDARRISLALKHTLYYNYIIQKIISETSAAFVSLTEKKDNETSLHLLRMSEYSHALAKAVAGNNPQVTHKFLREILWFAQLHDIGKIGIPDHILLKPGALDAEEWETMKSHVTIGEDIIRNMERRLQRSSNLELLSTAVDIISGHHEKWDGTGYPRGLSGEQIPLAGRIIALTDVFDALTSRRPYKEAFTVEKALSIMREGAGSHFDPDVFAAFEASLDTIMEIYETYKEV